MLRTDHNNLTSYFKQSDLNTRQARSNVFLSEFNFDIEHVKGKEKCVTDALSRKLHCIYEFYFNQAEFKF